MKDKEDNNWNVSATVFFDMEQQFYKTKSSFTAPEPEQRKYTSSLNFIAKEKEISVNLSREKSRFV